MSSPSAAVSRGQAPRVHVRPDAASPDLGDALFLASHYGLTLDPWQELVLGDWLARGPDGRFASLTCGLAVPRQNGKNAVIEVRELFGMIDRGERILHSAHEVKTARKAFKRLQHFFGRQVNDPAAKFPELNALVVELRNVNGQEAIVLANGGSVEIVARSKGSGRGFTVDTVIFDEAQDAGDEDLESLLPTTSAAPLGDPQWIFTGTPPGPKVQGRVFRRQRSASVPGAPRRCWAEWGVEADDLTDIDLDDQAIWHEHNPALAVGRLQIEVAAGERDALDDEGFARERLGWWGPDPDLSGSALPGWGALCDPVSDPGLLPVFAVAAADDLGYAAVSVSSTRPDGLFQVQTVEQAKGTAWLARSVAGLRERHPGAPVLVHQSLRGVVAGEEIGPADYERSCKSLLDAVDGSTFRHHGLADGGLASAVGSAVWSGSGSARRLVGRSGRDICQLQAGAIALHGSIVRPSASVDDNVW